MTVLQPIDRPRTGAPPTEEIAHDNTQRRIFCGIAIAINAFGGRSTPSGLIGTTMVFAVSAH